MGLAIKQGSRFHAIRTQKGARAGADLRISGLRPLTTEESRLERKEEGLRAVSHRCGYGYWVSVQYVPSLFLQIIK